MSKVTGEQNHSGSRRYRRIFSVYVYKGSWFW